MQRVLVVDDDDVIRDLLTITLQQAGYEVIEASNGRFGLEQINNSQVDLVITDIFMPEMDGIEFIAMLYQRSPHPKVIVMTGGSKLMDSSFSLKVAETFGVDTVLEKPMTPNSIINMVNSVLN